MNQLRARRRVSAVITAALALAVTVAMLPRARFLPGLTRSQICSQTHISHFKQYEHAGFAAHTAQMVLQAHFPQFRLAENYISPRAVRVSDSRLVRGPPLAS
jgi:hypothetical protein